MILSKELKPEGFPEIDSIIFEGSNPNVAEEFLLYHKKLKAVLNNLFLQQYGHRNTWAGMYVNCKKCGLLWAFGGNWNTKTPEEQCPYCDAQELLNKTA